MRLRLPWKTDKGGGKAREAQADRERLQEAAEAESDALRNRDEARSRDREVQRVVGRLKEFQQANHIGERVVQALRDGYGRREERHGH